MKFRLLYEGQIAPWKRGNLLEIHSIRQELDTQLRELWHHAPLSTEASKYLRSHDPDDPSSIGLYETRGATVFAPLVSKRIDLQCNLDITFLRKQAPGQLIGDGGDIDNRVKTLLDGLSVPPFSQQASFQNPASADPIYCLLQDDSLVIKLSVETDRLLRPTSNEHDLVAIIQVHVTASRLTFANIGIAN